MTGEVTQLSVPLERIVEICQRYQVVELAVFGSAARGEMRAHSDVDVVAEFAPGVVWGPDYFELERELGEAFGRRVDLATKKWLKAAVKPEILREARILFAA
jgi:predicted nucleotidyltransferase